MPWHPSQILAASPTRRCSGRARRHAIASLGPHERLPPPRRAPRRQQRQADRGARRGRTAPDGPDGPDVVGAATSGSRRQRRRVKRARAHRRRRQVIALAVTLVVVAAGAAVATDAVRLGSQDRPSLSRAVVEAGLGASPVAPSTSVPGLPCKSSLSGGDPLDVWVGGDSLAGSLGPAFGTIAGSTGVVQPYFHSRVSSGLANPGFVDWPALATKEMATVNPDIAVFIISTNDYGVPMNKTVDTATGEPAWKTTYTGKVEQMLDILGASGRTVYWLGAPVLRDTNQNEGVKELDALQQAVVKKHRNAVYVDTYALFADHDGKYATSVTGEDGKPIVARPGDGVHFTTDGAAYLAARCSGSSTPSASVDRAGGCRTGQADDPDRGEHAGRAGRRRDVGRVAARAAAPPPHPPRRQRPRPRRRHPPRRHRARPRPPRPRPPRPPRPARRDRRRRRRSLDPSKAFGRLRAMPDQLPAAAAAVDRAAEIVGAATVAPRARSRPSTVASASTSSTSTRCSPTTSRTPRARSRAAG